MFRPPPIKIDNTITDASYRRPSPLPHNISNSEDRPGSPIMSKSEYEKELHNLTNLRNKQYKTVNLHDNLTSERRAKHKKAEEKQKRLNQFYFANRYVTTDKDRVKLEESLLENDDKTGGKSKKRLRKSKKTKFNLKKNNRRKKRISRKNRKQPQLNRGTSKTRRTRRTRRR